MKQMHASIVIDLPTDEFAEAAAKLQVKPIWEALLKALKDVQIVHTAKLETLETRAKPAVRVPGKRRGRPPLQAVPVPALPVADYDPDEAA